MAGSASNITNNVNVTVPQSVTVPANGRTTVNVTVNVSGYAATLNEKFPNGAYIEGFVTLRRRCEPSVPYLGFYGDWEKASVLDRDFYYDQYLETAILFPLNGASTPPVLPSAAKTISHSVKILLPTLKTSCLTAQA